MDSIVWWNLSDKAAIGEENAFYAGLLREDCSEKPAYKALDELINKEWHTKIEVNASRRLNFAGFYGDYDIEAECDGKKFRGSVRLCRDTTGYDNRKCDFRTTEIILE